MDNIKKMSINQWAIEDRPREKMLQKGAQALSSAELVAILIGSGNGTESAVDLAKRVFQTYDNSIPHLFKTSISDLKKFKGIGVAKAISIMAAIELARRYEATKSKVIPEFIKASVDAFHAILPMLYELPYEEFWVLSLSQSNQILAKYKISQGGIASTTVDIRIIFQKILADNATALVLCHNHPSGSKEISTSDKALTEKVKKAAQIMDIRLLDHIVVAGDSYVSLADEGLL